MDITDPDRENPQNQTEGILKLIDLLTGVYEIPVILKNLSEATIYFFLLPSANHTAYLSDLFLSMPFDFFLLITFFIDLTTASTDFS
jgi:hypothetical protein